MTKRINDIASIIDDVRAEVIDLRAELARVTAERGELRAIIEGRKVAPTLAEIAKHSGEWLCDGRRVALYFADDNDTRFRAHVDAIATNDYLEGDEALRWLALQNDGETLWIALDDGRPCAWPKVTP